MEAVKLQDARIKIGLDDRTVIIDPNEWPVMAEVRGRHECGQAGQNGSTSWRVLVRAHADKRTIVYLLTKGGCQCEQPDPGAAGALVVDGERRQIELEARRLIQLGRSYGDDSGTPDADLRALMQSLPPEEL